MGKVSDSVATGIGRMERSAGKGSDLSMTDLNQRFTPGLGLGFHEGCALCRIE